MSIKGFKEFLAEGFINVIATRDDEARVKYAAAVFDLLQKTYASIGGIKGSGFASKEDMIANIPFWKLYFQGDRLIVAVLYKDKSGRKGVALGTDGSAKAKSILAQILKETAKVSFGEYSKGVLVFIFKNINIEFLRPYIVPAVKVSELLDTKIIIPTQEYVNDNLEPSDQALYNRYKDWREYFYVREIGGKLFLKMMIGTPYKHITV